MSKTAMSLPVVSMKYRSSLGQLDMASVNSAVLNRSRTFRENIVLLFCAATFVVVLTQTGIEFYVPAVFGSFVLILLFQKILLDASLSFLYMTVPSFFLLLYLILMSIPSMIIFPTMPPPVKYTYFLALQSVLITFPIGVMLANIHVQNPSKNIRRYLHSTLEKTEQDRLFLPFFKLFIISSFPIMVLYFLYSKHVQLIEVAKVYPTLIEKEALRFTANELPKIIHFLFEILRRFILPFCMLYAFFMALVYKSKWRITFWMLFFSTLVVSMMTLDRAPPAALFFMIIIAYLLGRNKSVLGAFNIKLIVMFAIASILGGAISIFQYQSDRYWDVFVNNVWYFTSYRLLQDPSYMASLAFENFNEGTGFLYGKAIRLFSVLLNFEYVESLDFAIPLAAAPVSFIGDLWRNWGWPGVIIGPICLGYLYQLIQLKLFTTKNVTSLTIYVIILTQSVWILYGNLLGIMSVTVFSISIFFGLLNNRRTKSYRHRYHKLSVKSSAF